MLLDSSTTLLGSIKQTCFSSNSQPLVSHPYLVKDVDSGYKTIGTTVTCGLIFCAIEEVPEFGHAWGIVELLWGKKNLKISFDLEIIKELEIIPWNSLRRIIVSFPCC